MAGFCFFLIDSDILLHNALPTTRPSAFFNDEMVLTVIPKPITKFLDLFIFLILSIYLYLLSTSKSKGSGLIFSDGSII